VSVAELLDLGSKSIRDDAPAGDSARDEPEFEALQQEMRKLELPTLPEVAWGDVVRGASALLETRSKDLLIAAWLCVGLYERDGLSGLAAGLTVLRDMLTGFWETLHPALKRMRGRTAALEWLGERGAQRVSASGSLRGTPEDLKTCLDRVGEIGEFLAERAPDGGTLLSELRRALSEAESRQAPSAAAMPAATAAPAAAASAPAVGAVSSPEDAQKALNEIRRLAVGAAAVLRETEPANPLAYRLPRQMVWARVTAAPPQTDGQTQIPSPGEIGQELGEALGRAEYKGVVQRAEDKLPTAILWLDLHRYTVSALEGMGEEYAPAAEAVCEELALLLKRVPELPGLRFADGTPLADDATRTWIASRVAGALGGGGGAAEPAPVAVHAGGEGEPEGLEEARLEARKLAGKKHLSEALRLLEEGAARAATVRARTLWKLETARLCLDRGQPAAGEALLENLDRELSRTSYEDWVPGLGAEVLKALLACRRKAGRAAGPEAAERNRELLGRLYRLDVSAALDADGKG